MSDAFVIALANPKGGTGKSTLAIHLAVAAHRVGNQTLLVDTDEQRSVLDWHRWTADDFDGPDVDDVTSPKRLKAQTGVWADAYDVVVLDGAASVQGMTGALVNVADALLIPVQASGLDVWGTDEFTPLVMEHVGAGDVRAAYVGSRRVVGSSLPDNLRDAFADRGIPFLEGTAQRVAYARSIAEGRTVFETSDDKAKAEIRQLLDDAANLFPNQ